MQEPPKQGFFKGFFGGGAKPLDREELFGGSNASSTIAVKTEGAKMTAAQVGTWRVNVNLNVDVKELHNIHNPRRNITILTVQRDFCNSPKDLLRCLGQKFGFNSRKVPKRSILAKTC